MREALTFDDVLLVPQYSEIASREMVDTAVEIGGIRLTVPVISANMDTVTWVDMAEAMWAAGGLGILHRFAPREEVIKAIQTLRSRHVPNQYIVPSLGVKDPDQEFAAILLGQGIESICVDVAHGDTAMARRMVEWCDRTGFKTIIAGNVATLEGAVGLEESGADVIKVGVGPGSVCTTRVMTGHGYPQLSAILEISDNLHSASIIADGGMKTPGDIVKALAAGASAVMLGYMLAGCEETPGYQPGMKLYRGSASKGANGNAKYIEGVDALVRANGSARKVVGEIEAGIRSGCTYSGARSIEDLWYRHEFVRVTSATVVENGPHGRQP